jgi:hypothetical protein
MLALVLVAVGVLAVALVIALAMRKVTFDEARDEAALKEPGAHTVSYVVPNGQDASVLIAALTHAGFKAVGGMERGQERVLVACSEGDRGEVRRIIESVHEANFGGPELHVAHVRFEDER